VQNYYKETSLFKGDKEYLEFKRYEKEDVNTRTPPWFNKEIFVKLFMADEGRDFDNQHGFPYLSLQVRFDREKNEKVRFDDKQIKNYMRN
jgi:hypothetical protein